MLVSNAKNANFVSHICKHWNIGSHFIEAYSKSKGKSTIVSFSDDVVEALRERLGQNPRMFLTKSSLQAGSLEHSS